VLANRIEERAWGIDEDGHPRIVVAVGDLGYGCVRLSKVKGRPSPHPLQVTSVDLSL